MAIKKYLLICLSGALLTSCAYVNPLIEDANTVSVTDEVKIGQQMQTEVAKEMTVSQSATLTAMGNRLIAALPKKDFDYHFYVVANDEPNAFTIPGGTIYVHTGLLKFADDENEVAGVLAHEIGHAFERHPAKSITRQMGMAQIADKLAGANSALWKQMTLKIAGVGALNFYSRTDESEADRIGFELLRKTGYSPDGLTRFLQKLAKLQTGKQTPAFLSTHPPTPERVAALESLQKNLH